MATNVTLLNSNDADTAYLKKSEASTSYLPLTGGTLTGALTLSGAPTTDLQASTKAYVDDSLESRVEINSEELTGQTRAGLFNAVTDATTKVFTKVSFSSAEGELPGTASTASVLQVYVNRYTSAYATMLCFYSSKNSFYMCSNKNGTVSDWEEVAKSDNAVMLGSLSKLDDQTRSGMFARVDAAKAMVFGIVQFTKAESPNGKDNTTFNIVVINYTSTYGVMIATTGTIGASYICYNTGGTPSDWHPILMADGSQNITSTLTSSVQVSLKRDLDTGSLTLYGGTDANGSLINLYGKSHSSYPGWLAATSKVATDDSTSAMGIYLKPSGIFQLNQTINSNNYANFSVQSRYTDGTMTRDTLFDLNSTAGSYNIIPYTTFAAGEGPVDDAYFTIISQRYSAKNGRMIALKFYNSNAIYSCKRLNSVWKDWEQIAGEDMVSSSLGKAIKSTTVSGTTSTAGAVAFTKPSDWVAPLNVIVSTSSGAGYYAFMNRPQTYIYVYDYSMTAVTSASVNLTVYYIANAR